MAEEAKKREDANVRRPDQDIPDRPRLRVRSRDQAEGEEAAERPAVRAGSLFKADGEGEGKGEEGEAEPTERPKVVVPPLEGRYPYATYRSAPEDEEAEQRRLEAAGGTSTERRVSTGFVLGVALVVVVLVGGIWLAHLGKKVGRLESRITRLEQPAEAPGSSAAGHIP
ncbi:MAG: hypothetical protein R6V05_02495 [Candidatus Brocadiia bacterium]